MQEMLISPMIRPLLTRTHVATAPSRPQIILQRGDSPLVTTARDDLFQPVTPSFPFIRLRTHSLNRSDSTRESRLGKYGVNDMSSKYILSDRLDSSARRW